MPFVQSEYKTMKAHILEQLNNPPWCYQGKDIIDWAGTFWKMIEECEDKEDYEGAKAVKDATVEFINQYVPIPEEKIVAFYNKYGY